MISDFAVALVKFQFLGFPLSQVSVVSANNVVNVVNFFFSFVLSPIAAVAKTQLLRHTSDTFKTWMPT